VSFKDFKQRDGGEPVDGEHTAWLERTSVFEAKSGAWFIRTCWRTTDLDHYWETLNATEGNGKERTQQLLEAIGIDVESDTLESWDDLGDELVAYEGRIYSVKVSHRGEYLNTAVIGTPQGIQDELRPDTRDLPEPRTAAPPAPAAGGLFDEAPPAAPVPAGGIFDDDDIPF
jgi:hypothetical protein